MDYEDEDYESGDFESECEYVEEEDEEDEEEEEEEQEQDWFSKAMDNRLKWEAKSIVASLTGKKDNDMNVQFQCPVCNNNPDWYPLQSLFHHACTTIRRFKFHRRFAHWLAFHRRLQQQQQHKVGGNILKNKVPLSEFHKSDKIVWPPSIILRNTRKDVDDTGKFIGMDIDELLSYFSDYKPVKVKHAYDVDGQRGLSLLVFSPSCVGYFNAQRLEAHFKRAKRGKLDWFVKDKSLHDLYGYYPTPEDMEDFKPKMFQWAPRLVNEVVYTPLQQLEQRDEGLARNAASTEQLKETMDKLIPVQGEYQQLVKELQAVVLLHNRV